MRVGIDIDGVLFPWDEAARDSLVTKFGIERPGPSTYWNYLKDATTREQWVWLWSAEGQDAVFGQVHRVYPGAVAMVNDILRAGPRVHFVTHRDPLRTIAHTASFLRTHFGGHPWAGVHVVQNSVSKCGLLEWDAFIDDKPETCVAMLNDTGARVFSPVRPWNDELHDVEMHGLTSGLPRLTRYTDPRQVSDWVLSR